jgi:zinc transporter ZupT
MGELTSSYALWAAAIGAISAVSLPLGSAVGLAFRPREVLTATLAAFGAGALIAALAVELVAPAAQRLVDGGHGHGGDPRIAFLALLGGAAAGGVLFVVLDRLLAERGGFLRKTATSIAHFAKSRARRDREMLEDLCAIPLLRQMPSSQVGLLLRDVRSLAVAAGERLYNEGDPATTLFFVRDGQVELSRAGGELEQVGAGGMLGELGLVTDAARHATATARGPVTLYGIGRDDVERWRATCPEFDAGVRSVALERLSLVQQRDAEKGEEERRWGEAAVRSLRNDHSAPSEAELSEVAKAYPGSPLAVWLGLLIDGIPESIVIGAGFMALASAELAAHGSVEFANVVPYTLVAGLFLSNFPEALSSSVGLQSQGWRAAPILGLWIALLAVTAVGAAIGFLIGGLIPHTALAFVEGLAAGAMLTAIASTMIPEAVHLGGSASRVGLATLGGFLAAVAFKLLE